MKTVDALFEENIEYANKIAYRWASRNHQLDQLDRWENSALIGLWEACRKWDESKGLRFITYSLWIIRGRILDDVRSSDKTTRNDRRFRAKEYNEVSIDAPLPTDGRTRTLEDVRLREPCVALETREEFEMAWGKISDERARQIIHEYFFLDLRQIDIAKIHGLTESRINQIITATLETMRRIA